MSTPIHSVAVQGTEQVFIRQEWSAYTGEQHRAWSLLFRKRRDSLRNTACRAFLEGIELIGLNEHTIPDLEELNGRLQPCTGWSAIPVSGFLHPHDFFCCLAQRKFPTTVTIRPLGRLDYIPEPDIFHDVFGHVPNARQ